MPGVIQVSVLDFEGPPSSSSSPSPLSIKVSLGKREYKMCDNGDFSVPLTTIRDDLIVTLQDADGNEISHTGVKTRLVVEKGLWNDLFPLQGGGHVHMKLQFVLSDAERNRVRLMRESVLKRKHEELLKSDPIISKSAASFDNEVSDSQKRLLPLDMVSIKEVANRADLAPNPVNFFEDEKYVNKNISGTHSDQKPTSPKESAKEQHDELPTTSVKSSGSALTLDSPDHEVSDSQKRIIPVKAVSIKEEATEAGLLSQPVNFYKDEIFGTKNVEGIFTKQIQKTPNDTDRSEETSSTALVSQHIGVHLTEVRYRDSGAAETETQTSPADVPVRDTSSKVASSLLEFSGLVLSEVKNTLSAKLEPDGAENREKQTTLQKTPTNVRKMISAFEGSQAQEVKPFVEPTPTKSKLKKIGTEAPSRNQHQDESTAGNKSTESSSRSIVNYFPTRKLQQAPKSIKQREEQIGSVRALDGAKLLDNEAPKEASAKDTQTEGKNPSSKNKFEVFNKKYDMKEGKKFPENVSSTSAIERTPVSERIFSKHLGGDHPHKFFSNNVDSDGSIDIEESQIGGTNELREVDSRGASGGNIVTEENRRGETKELREVDGRGMSGGNIVIEETQRANTRELRGVDNRGTLGRNVVIEEIQRADTRELREVDNRGTLGRNIGIEEIQRADTRELQEVDNRGTLGRNIVIEEIKRADTRELREVDNRGTLGRNNVIEEIQRGGTKELQEGDSPGTSGRDTVIEESRKVDTKELQELDSQGFQNNKLNSTAAYWEEKYYALESSGAWIFFNEPKHFCVTTSSQQVLDLMNACEAKSKSHERKKRFSAPEKRKEVNEGDKKSNNQRKPELVNSADVEASKGPVEQAIKLAIMIGFGTLVILTRQRENRKL